MQWIIPGTVLSAQREEADLIENQLNSMFMGGGIVLSQVAAITGLEPYTIQNWVKRGFLSAPVKKRYSLRQLCRILNINALKNVLHMDQIVGLLGYINGNLEDESDDIIDDTQLYCMFVRLAARVRELYSSEDRDTLLEHALQDYTEPVPGARERVKKTLCVMLTAFLAARMAQEAAGMLQSLKKE